jgi:tRNA 2-selenouridine synthase
VRISVEEFLELRKRLPVADVRSEGEFEQGHIPGAVNIPILRNDERHLVGLDYKQQGQLEAIRTGFRLVGPRLPQLIDEAQQLGSELIVHCWRGGMRSQNFCRFVEMAKQKTHQLEGGYKAYRIAVHELFAKPLTLTVLAGSTGSGKSEILRSLERNGEQIIDLEHLANHKGSVFGGLMMPLQPSTEQFENDLFETLLKLDPNKRIWIEDESVAVGNIFLPISFWNQKTKSPIIEIELNKVKRVARLVAEYGNADRKDFLEAMTKIAKRLGNQHFKAAKEKLAQGDMASTIDILLTYYDKAYRNGLNNKTARIQSQVTWDGADANEFSKQLLAATLQNQNL